MITTHSARTVRIGWTIALFTCLTMPFLTSIGHTADEEEALIVVQNQSKRDVRMMLVNGNRERDFGGIKPLEASEFHTIVGFRWVIRDAQTKEAIQEVTAEKGRQTVMIVDRAPVKVETILAVMNKTDAAIDVYRVNSLNREVFLSELPAGQAVQIPALVGQQWVFREHTKNQELKRHTVIAGVNTLNVFANKDHGIGNTPGFSPVDPTNALALMAAEFAALKNGARLGQLLRAEAKVDNGAVQFQLLMSVQVGTEVRVVKAGVLQQPQPMGFRLTEFEALPKP